MANRLLDIVDIIDAALQAYPIKDISFNGLCQLEIIRDEKQPIYYNGHSWEPVSFNEKSALNIYHRLISIAENNNLSGGFGTNSLKSEAFNMTMVVFGNQNKIDKEKFDISYRVADELKGLIPMSFTSAQLTALESQTIIISHTGINHDKRSVFETELPDNKKYFIKPENIFFSINYTITANYLQECKTLQCE